MAREVRLTKEGYERLKAELEKWQQKLEEITKILQELMESSDDYDDSGLEDAKREKARIEAAIAQLEDVLSRAVIIEGAESADRVTLGSLVVIQDTATGEEYEVQIVSPAEASVLTEPMKISDESPVGSSLLDKREGDTVKVVLPNGELKEYRILSISAPAAAAKETRA